MIRLLADENFNNDVVRGVRRRNPGIDIVTVQDVGLSGAEDPVVLEWASRVARILLTHDVATMMNYAKDRVQQALPMPGVFEIGRHVSIRMAIDEIEILAECSAEGEWEGQVRYLPLR
jgi:hypothetical protein